MAKTNTFECSVVTPERSVLTCDATFVAFPAHDGEMGVLPRRAPLVCKLGIGVLRVETPQEKHVMLIEGGFGQVLENRLTLLTQQARKADELDVTQAGQDLVEARAMKITDEASLNARSDALRRAQIELTLAKSGN